jgi:hypothetical protein
MKNVPVRTFYLKNKSDIPAIIVHPAASVPYGHNLAIWAYSHIASKMVEQAANMQQSGEGIKSIGPSYGK